MKYCVYEHWNINGCYYVGAGSIKNKRAYLSNSRSKEWLEQYNIGFTVRIIKEFEDRKEAFDFEAELTKKHLLEKSPLVNKGIGTHLYGEANGMYGKGYLLKGKKKSQEHIDKIVKSLKTSGKLSGENNPMFGVSMEDRLKTKEDYEAWKKSCARNGAKNGNARKIKVENIETGVIKSFDTLTEASKFTNIPGSTIAKHTRNKKIYIRNNFRLERF